MRELFKYFLLPCLLFIGFLFLLVRLRILKALKLMLLKARVSIEDRDRQTKLLQRKNLGEFEKKNKSDKKERDKKHYPKIRIYKPQMLIYVSKI